MLSDLVNRHYEQLASIRQRFDNRRTVAYGLVDECMQLVESAMVEAEAHAAGRIAEAERGAQSYRDMVDSQRTRVKQLEESLAAKRDLREKRERSGEEVQVTIDRSLNGWTIGDLEEVAYRLRVGGAVDDTTVKMTDYSATAKVVAPELVPLHRPGSEPAPRQALLPDPVVPDAGLPRWAPFAAAAGGLGLALAVVADLVVRVIT